LFPGTNGKRERLNRRGIAFVGAGGTRLARGAEDGEFHAVQQAFFTEFGYPYRYSECYVITEP
jgi:hypothetical protein